MKLIVVIFFVFMFITGCSTTQNTKAEQAETPNTKSVQANTPVPCQQTEQKIPSPLQVVKAELAIKNESLNFVMDLAKDLKFKVVSSVEVKTERLSIVTLEGPKQVLECFIKVLGGGGHIIGAKIGPSVRIG